MLTLTPNCVLFRSTTSAASLSAAASEAASPIGMRPSDLPPGMLPGMLPAGIAGLPTPDQSPALFRPTR